jgi:hypothetical protein
MGRPTIAEQIAKAAASGDLEKVQQLAAKMQNKTKTKKPRVKKQKPEPEVQIEYKSEDDFIAPAKSGDERRNYTDEGGVEHVRMKTVPFIIKKRKNTWTDDQTEDMDDVEFDKKVRKHNLKVKKRESTSKIKVKCIRCNEMKEVWPGEVMNKNYSCNDCLAGLRKR